ncbi:MAG TPA: substrate-binding domain-containing protein, partial [Flavisolibacter sp.]|nr:substrate-binding domain-containing protein [Flavisolibacter sp.]
IGLIVDDISNFFFGHLARTVEEAAGEYGYTVMFCNSENNQGKSRDVLGKLVDRQMDGYIIAPTIGMLPEIKNLLTAKKPVVMIDRYYENVPGSYVTIDNYQGAFDSVNLLIEKGYRNIGLVTNQTEQIQIVDRLKGYKNALKKNNLPFNKELVKKIPFKYNEERIVDVLVEYLGSNDHIDAVLFTSNNLGIPGLESIRKVKKKVPGDIAVICFDDNDLFRLASPGISVVSQPIKAIGREAIKILLDQIENIAIQEKHVVLAPNLIIRDSTPGK